jgi:C1A family cysteine protease
MYQPVRYYDYERREGSNCCCLLFLIGLLSVASFAVVLTASSEVLRSPIASLLEDVEISLAFNDFIRDFDKSYANDADMQYRKGIFAKNYRKIKELNEEHTMATFEVNSFADLTDEEFEEQYLDPAGASEKCTVAQERAFRNPTVPADPNSDLDINWVAKGKVSPVKNQGSCGSCWTFATMTVIETIYAIRENQMLQFAEQQIVDCCKKQVSAECQISDGCRGGLISEGFQYAINKGVMLETHYPYKARDEVCTYESKKDNIVFKPHGFVDIKEADVKEMENVLQTRTIAVGLAASSAAFRYYRSGVLEKSCPETPLNHGVAIVGAGTEGGVPYWLVRNSWDKTWGDGGYIKIARSLKDYPTGVCGIASCPEYIKYKE